MQARQEKKDFSQNLINKQIKNVRGCLSLVSCNVQNFNINVKFYVRFYFIATHSASESIQEFQNVPIVDTEFDMGVCKLAGSSNI